MKLKTIILVIILVIISADFSCKKMNLQKERKRYYPNHLTILVGEFTKSPIVVNAEKNFTTENDIFKINQSIKIKIKGNNTSALIWNLEPTIFHANAQNIGIFLYFKDSTKISNITLEIYSSKSDKWVRSISNQIFHVKLKSNWYLYRWPSFVSNTKNFGNNTSKIKLIIKTKETTEISIGYIFAEIPEKAKLFFIEDGGYSKGWINTNLVKGQTTGGEEDCALLKMPITWALNPNKVPLSDIDSLYETISLPYLLKMKQNKNNYWSFHSFDRQPLATLSEKELKLDIKNSIEWLDKYGFGPIHFRAAHTQNKAFNAYKTFNYMGLKSFATYNRKTGGFETFPFTERYNLTRWAIHNKTWYGNSIDYKKIIRWYICRWSIHNQTHEQIDKIFTTLKQNRCIALTYTHKIISDDSNSFYDIKLESWQYFLYKVKQGVSENWLELVSYPILEQEFNKYNIEDNDLSISNAIIKELQEMTIFQNKNKTIKNKNL